MHIAHYYCVQQILVCPFFMPTSYGLVIPPHELSLTGIATDTILLLGGQWRTTKILFLLLPCYFVVIGARAKGFILFHL